VRRKVKKRTIANPTTWSPDLIEAFRSLLRGGVVVDTLPGTSALRYICSIKLAIGALGKAFLTPPRAQAVSSPIARFLP